VTVLSILHEDAWMLVVAKPAGLSTQAPPLAGETLETLVRSYLDRDVGGAGFVGTVHRLDRPVSGVVVWAKTQRAARLLARQFERREVRKEYWAVTEGRPGADEGLWEDWIVREETGLGCVQVCRAGTPRSQAARTRYRVIDGARVPEGWTMVVMWPETGRMHQLRVQLGSRGAPVVGDSLYGSGVEFGPGEIALHGRSVVLRHPDTGRPVRFEAPLPAAWRERGVEIEV
jgi:23S rRNA pseudouridine1911/1915/1917 synthase